MGRLGKMGRSKNIILDVEFWILDGGIAARCCLDCAGERGGFGV